MMRNRVLAGVLLLAAGLGAVKASAADLPLADDLRQDARQAQQERLPVLVFFSAKSCHYCEEMRDLYLTPMYTSGNYDRKVIMREVQVESGLKLRDFQGNRVSHADFASRFGVSFTPQVRFLDPDGRELVPALVGLSTPEFFSGYLEEAIDAAVAKMRAPR